MYKSFLIKYAEIAIKGKNRYLFEDALVSQINHALKKADGEFLVRKEQGRIYVDTLSDYDYDEVVEALKCVFGIVGICPVVLLEDEGFDKLAEEVIAYIDKVYPDKHFTFKVNARRARKNYPMESMEINAAMGEKILDAYPETKVDVHHPQVVFNIEIRAKINVYSTIIPGPGGMPVGTNGKAMLLLSGGIDSPVAGYMIAKRGVTIDATYFHAPPYTSERAKQKVVDLAKIVAKYSGPINLHVVNFTDIQLYIYEQCPHEELTIIMRRYMMKLAEHFAKENKCLGLITGESIGQVSEWMVVDSGGTCRRLEGICFCILRMKDKALRTNRAVWLLIPAIYCVWWYCSSFSAYASAIFAPSVSPSCISSTTAFTKQLYAAFRPAVSSLPFIRPKNSVSVNMRYSISLSVLCYYTWVKSVRT